MKMTLARKIYFKMEPGKEYEMSECLPRGPIGDYLVMRSKVSAPGVLVPEKDRIWYETMDKAYAAGGYNGLWRACYDAIRQMKDCGYVKWVVHPTRKDVLWHCPNKTKEFFLVRIK